MLRSVFTLINVCFVLLLYSQSSISSQEDVSSFSSANSLNNLVLPNSNSKEDIKLHLSSSSYFYDVGESVFINLLVVNAESLQPVVYNLPCQLTLFNARNQKVSTEIIECVGGSINKVYDDAFFKVGGEYRLIAECLLNGRKIFSERHFILQQTIEKNIFIELTTNKEQYIAGDSLHLKIKVRLNNGAFAANKPVCINEIYLDQPIDTLKVNTNEVGEINYVRKIDASYNENNLVYLVRVLVGDAWESRIERINLNTDKVVVSTFFENGTFRFGRINSIVLSTTNDFGDLTKASCMLYNIRTKDSFLIETNDYGFGKFTLAAGDSLQNYILYAGNNRQSFYGLQPSKESLVSIETIQKHKDFIRYKISSDSVRILRFISHLRGKVIKDTFFTIQPGNMEINLNIQQLMPGVLQAVILNQRNEIMAQKLSFVNRQKHLKVVTSMGNKPLPPNNDYMLDFKVTDENNQPVEGVFNLSITDHKNKLLIEDKQTRISENLLFESDLNYPVKDIGKLWKSPVVNKDSLLDLFLNGCRLNEVYLPGILNRTAQKTTFYYQFILEDKTIYASANLQKDIRRIIVKSDMCTYRTNINERNEIYIPVDSISFPARVIIHGLGRKEIIYVNETHAKIALKSSVSPLLSIAKKDSFYNVANLLPEIFNPILIIPERNSTAYFVDGVRVYSNCSKSLLSSCSFSTSTRNLCRTGTRDLNALVAMCSGVTRTSTGLSGRGSRTDGTAYYVDGVRLMSANDIPGSANVPEQVQYFGSYSSGYSAPYVWPTRYKIRKYRANGTTMERYQHVSFEYFKGSGKEKKTTYYWETGLTTNALGEFSKMVRKPDKTMVWHLSLEGIGLNGSCAEYDTTIAIQQEIYMNIKAPERMLNTDTAIILCTVYNNTPESKSLYFHAEMSDDVLNERLFIAANSFKVINLKYYNQVTENMEVELLDAGGKVIQKISHLIRIEERRYSTQQIKTLFNEKIEDVFIPETAEKYSAKINIYNSNEENLENKMLNMMREPYGCFEQVSSTNYPNILAYQHLKRSVLNENDRLQLAEKKQYLLNGYAKLVNYETPTGGFSWYGDGRGNQALTAMGLLQFVKLKKCDVEVSEAMITRSKEWLFQSRNNAGVFIQSQGKYGFANTRQDVAHAYITYVLSELGEKNLESSIMQIRYQLETKPNLYNQALLFAIVLKQKDKISAKLLFDELVKKTEILINGKTMLTEPISTIVNSGYYAALNESLCIVANSIFADNNSEFLPLANRIGNYIMARDFNTLGNMQTKAMAIETIDYSSRNIKPFKSPDKFLTVVINSRTLKFEFDSKKNKNIDISEYLLKGDNTVRIIGDTNTRINGDLVLVKYFAAPPAENISKDLSISATYHANHLKAGEVLKYQIALANKSDKVLPQTVAIIPIPAGINIAPEELLFLKKQHIVDFYEITDGNIVLYFEEMDAKQSVRFTLPLVCEIKGSFDTRGSCIYKYYQPENKSTCLAGKILIE